MTRLADAAGATTAPTNLGGMPARIAQADIARTARELVAAYGPTAVQLMRRRTRAVRRRGDAESATLWLAVTDAIEQELSAGPQGWEAEARCDKLVK